MQTRRLFTRSLVALCLVAPLLLGGTASTASAKGSAVEAPCKKLIGAVRYKKDAMGLSQMDGPAQGAFLAGDWWAKATDARARCGNRNSQLTGTLAATDNRKCV